MKVLILNSHNSFSALDNNVISSIALNMGVIIDESDFDVVEIMKDLEVARHALHKKSEITNNVEEDKKK